MLTTCSWASAGLVASKVKKEREKIRLSMMCVLESEPR